VLSSTPFATTTTDSNGNYSFSGLPTQPAGTDWVVREVNPSGYTQTYPLASAPNTTVLPDGLVGYVVPGLAGVPATTQTGQSVILNGTGTITLNSVNGPSITIFANNGSQSTTVSTIASPLNVTFRDSSNNASTFNVLCADLFDQVSIGQTWGATVQDNLATAFTNGKALAYFASLLTLGNLTPTQQDGLVVAAWDASLNHTLTPLVQDSNGHYHGVDPGVFDIQSLGGDANGVIQAANGFLVGASTLSSSVIGAWFQASGGQHLLAPVTQFNFGDVNSKTVPFSTPADCPFD
jgi:hypothetical protein